MMRTIGDSSKWHSDNGDYTHRLNYNLNNESIVFDLGANEGWFVEQINNKFGSKIFCFEPINKFITLIEKKFIKNKNIIILPFAISDKNETNIIYYNDNSSSIYVKNDEPIKINCITLDEVINKYKINKIDLIKINIEGEEYKLLEYIIKNNLIEKCMNIQVQFHVIIEDYEKRYNLIKTELEKTHHLTYKYPFVWENWEKN